MMTVAYTFRQCFILYSGENKIFNYAPYANLEYDDINLVDHDDSFNMLISINLASFDWKNNPYISAYFYEALDEDLFESGESELIKSKRVELDYCNGGDQDLCY